MAGNDVEWTSEQMIKNANSWSLAGDVALLNRLKQFSKHLLSETVAVSENVDNLLNNLENVSLKLDLTKNEFQSLRNTQFIENRVYEDDETLEKEENKEVKKELTDEEKQNAIKESIVEGLKVVEEYFEKIEVSVSDSEEEENEKSYILRPIDPYADRPLPYLVGSDEWHKHWHVGLLPSDSESESEKEEEVYSSSDSEEGLIPKDKNLGSETSSELDFVNKNTGPVANSTFNDTEGRRRVIFHSSDESSDQSNSVPVKAPISDQNFAEQLAAKLGDVINKSADNEEHTNRNPIKKVNQSSKYGNLFSDEPPPLDDLEDTVLPKSAHEGLFSGGRDLFGGSTEDDLFWDQGNKTSQNIKITEDRQVVVQEHRNKPNLKVSKGLFDASDSSEDDDMFTAAEKRKVMVAQPYLQPHKPAIPFVDDRPPEIASTTSAASKKKPIGGVSIFGENTNIFGENSGKPGFETTKISSQDIQSKPTASVRKSLKKTSLFDESSDEEEITPKNIHSASNRAGNEQTYKKLDLFSDADDLVPPKEKKKLSLFDEGDTTPTVSKKKLGLSDENPYKNVSSFRPTTEEIADKTENLHKTGLERKKPVKKISLFDDDYDFLKEEEDIFASAPKDKSLFHDIDKTQVTTRSKGIFEETEDDTSSSIQSATEEIHSKGLETKYSSEIVPRSSKIDDKAEKKLDEGLGDEKLEKKSIKTSFDGLETSGSSEDLFGGLKAQDVSQKEGYTIREGAEDLFEDIGSSASAKSENLSVKPKGISLFEDSDNDEFFGSADIEEKSKSSVVGAKNDEDLFSIGRMESDDLVEKTKDDNDELKDIVDTENLENVANKEIVSFNNSPKQDEPSNTKIDAPGQTEDVMKHSKGKTVGFFDSDSDSSSDDHIGFREKSNADQETTRREDIGEENALFKDKDSVPSYDEGTSVFQSYPDPTESSPKQDEPSANLGCPKSYAVPPPLDLFDPTPPPLDWDAASDNSGESDTFSLTDGILNRTNLNHSQARSSLFDEAPPSLDVNDSSGIVRDFNVTRVEPDDSSFFPHASSSRRLSSDIFGEQQSQDSFFITKSGIETSIQSGPTLHKIPENLDNMSSKIEDLTPSGNLEDFEGDSSVFESKNMSKVSMDNTTSVLDVKKRNLFQSNTKESDNEGSFVSKNSDNIKQKATLFADKRSKEEEEDAKEKSNSSPNKTSPGKLQHSLKIDVSALMPGAARPKPRPTIAKLPSPDDDETDKSTSLSPAIGVHSLAPPAIGRITASKSAGALNKADADGKFDSLSQTEVLHSATKDRARIPVKRRPSSRRARQEAVRKSMTDFSLYQNEENSGLDSSAPSQNVSSDGTNRFLKDLNSKLGIPDGVASEETSRTKDSAEALDFDAENEKLSVKREEALGRPAKAGSLQDTEDIKPVRSQNEGDLTSKAVSSSKHGGKNTFDDLYEDDVDLFKTASKSKRDKSIFGDNASSEEDLFSDKSNKGVSSTAKAEEISSKSSIFFDKSDSDVDDNLFTGIPRVSGTATGKKLAGETSKKASIFDDSDENSEDDLFSSKSSKSRGESIGVSGNTGPVFGTTRDKSKNVKVAGVRKLENKEVTDFDPLSALK